MSQPHPFALVRGAIVPVAVILLLVWQWHLVLALGMGAAVMLAVYFAQQQPSQARISTWLRELSGQHRRWIWAVGSGGLTALGSYLAIAIWKATDNPWLALGVLLQGAIVTATLGLTLWQTVDRQADRPETDTNRLLTRLTHAHPIERFLAVRQLNRALQTPELAPQDRRAIGDCFDLMLHRETEAIVRNAVLEGLRTLTPERSLPRGTRPFSVPTHKARQSVRVNSQQP